MTILQGAQGRPSQEFRQFLHDIAVVRQLPAKRHTAGRGHAGQQPRVYVDVEAIPVLVLITIL